MIVNTIKAYSLEHLKEILKPASNACSLVFAFASTDIDHVALYDLLTDKHYIAVSSSTGGQFFLGDLLNTGIVCMTLALPENSFKVKRYDLADNFTAAGHALGEFARTAFNESDALIFANSYADIDHEALLEGFQKGARNRVCVYGGLASNAQQDIDNYIGIDGVVSQRAVGVVVFDTTKVALQGVLVGGWEAIGTYKTVTKSVGRKVYELDNHPIKDVFKDYFNYDSDSSYSTYSEFPVQVLNKNGGTVIRTIADVDNDGFYYSGHIPEGAKVYFCSPSITKTVSTSINEINDFQSINNLMSSDAVLVFSCSARLHSFGFYIQNEVRSFNEMWGAKHAGFFSHGEIGRYNDKNADNLNSILHNSSISVIFFKDLTESASTAIASNYINYHEQKLDVSNVIDEHIVIEKLQEQKLALSNLLQRTSVDLNNALRELDQYKKGLEQKVEAQLADIKELNKEIVDTQKEVIFTMGSIAETRSKETGNHVIRVAEYSKVFALKLGLGEEIAELIKQASPMHDIGKVGIPDAILHKPSWLTVNEFETMKTHAELGYSMLNHSSRPILQVAATIALEHHEKWDGSGYPRGLAGKDIHLYGRIIAIADVFDALGSTRCYKQAWQDQQIWDYFKAQRGKHFDPELVDLFFEHIDTFIDIRQRYRDI